MNDFRAPEHRNQEGILGYKKIKIHESRSHALNPSKGGKVITSQVKTIFCFCLSYVFRLQLKIKALHQKLIDKCIITLIMIPGSNKEIRILLQKQKLIQARKRPRRRLLIGNSILGNNNISTNSVLTLCIKCIF